MAVAVPHVGGSETVNDFIGFIRDVWNSGVFQTDFGRVLVALGILLAALVFRQLFTVAIIRTLRNRAARTRSTLDDKIIGTLEAPIRFAPIVIGLFFAVRYLGLDADASAFADKVLRSLVVFTLFWALFNAAGPIAHSLKVVERVFNSSMVDWIAKIMRAAVAAIGAATVLEIWGIKVGPILAGAGLFGVAVALGAQDLFKNLISGFLILAEKRFRVGDWILVDGVVEGTVETIGFRSTVVRRFDKAPVYVPNAQLSDTAVTNFSAMTHRRIYWTVRLEYRTTVDQLRRVRDGIERYIHECPDFASPEEVATFVRIDKFSDHSIDLMIYCFTRTINWGEWLEIKERLACRIKEIVEEAGTAFALPSRKIYVDADEPVEAAKIVA